jgi:hypothetical protein
MESKAFDRLARRLSALGTRRAVLAALLGPGITVALRREDSSADDRRKRREDRRRAKHKRRDRRRGGGRGAPCPDSLAETCAGKCGRQVNRCGQDVECGSCVCGGCPICQICDAAAGVCRPNPNVVGQVCANCQTCNAAGACAPVSCPPGQSCQFDVCGVPCGHEDFCPGATEICDAGNCKACDVCPTCRHTTIQSAVDAAESPPRSPILICAGVYSRQGTNRVANISGKNVTLIGAGVDRTIIDGGNVATSQPVLGILRSTTNLEKLTVRGANGSPGITVQFPGTLSLKNASVNDNHNDTGNGGGIFNGDLVRLDVGAIITGNSAASGGGIFNGRQIFRNQTSRIDHNRPDDCVGGFGC